MSLETNNSLPFAMRFLDRIPDEIRGYKEIPEDPFYDPVTQVSSLLLMGGTLVLTSYQQRDSDTKSDKEDDDDE